MAEAPVDVGDRNEYSRMIATCMCVATCMYIPVYMYVHKCVSKHAHV